jgi:hypothetical protein
METYKPNNWGFNGPDMITKIFHDYCKLPNPEVSEARCDSLNLFVFQRNRAFPVFYSKVRNLFNPNFTQKYLERVKYAHFIHLNSHVSKKFNITKSSPTAFNHLTERLCPVIRRISDDNFN